ncbi:MAG: hypothetical protein ACE5JA_07820 [bacterium]
MAKFLTVHKAGKELPSGAATGIGKAFKASLSVDAYWTRSWYARDEGRLYSKWDAKDANSIRRVMAEAAPEFSKEGIHGMKLVCRREEGRTRRPEEGAEFRLMYPEVVFALGIIGCMLFAIWQLAHLIADNWPVFWVAQNGSVIRRVVLYGFALFMSVASLLITTRLGFRFGRFGETIKRSFLWYGIVMLVATVGVFVFDSLPGLFAYIVGACLFIVGIYIFQKRCLKERET